MVLYHPCDHSSNEVPSHGVEAFAFIFSRDQSVSMDEKTGVLNTTPRVPE